MHIELHHAKPGNENIANLFGHCREKAACVNMEHFFIFSDFSNKHLPNFSIVPSIGLSIGFLSNVFLIGFSLEANVAN